MKLNRIYSDYMVVQRGMPVYICGSSDQAEETTVRWNGKKLFDMQVQPGVFHFFLPSMEAQTDATLEVGDLKISHIDVGEVWIAGGQSNMEFLMKYEETAQRALPECRDGHVRVYTVGQYAFPEERELGYKDWQDFDRWLPLQPDTAERMTAVGVFFAKAVREKYSVPVGVISCNWSGTTAGTWISRERLEKVPALHPYLEEYEKGLEGVDLRQYQEAMRMVRPAMASRMTDIASSGMMKYTFHPKEAMQKTMEGYAAAFREMRFEAAPEMGETAARTMEMLRIVGPGDKNVPGALYDTMLREILGVSARGILWYQGEQDEGHGAAYETFFTELIRCWREDWRAANPHMEKLPFLFAQLAPFGTWRGGTGANFPEIRASQGRVAENVPDTYMASTSDIGNIYDVHPKNKRDVAKRLFLLAEKYLYGESGVKADAPALEGMVLGDGKVTLSFRNAESLLLEPGDFRSYNGFSVKDAPSELLPPVLGGVNGLEVWVDGEQLGRARIETEGNQLSVLSDRISTGAAVQVRFAQTGFYEINLYNEAGIPAIPFMVSNDG
ncbi:MAG: sialate O-acetylesterase [Roseburia sp.]|nr:sialate O-acetylesterase [Roseburia sp.]MCM1099397.1 sialate O-acetylesterase [Ruminococcus flavefaciens]MCM1222286.1 sialate O-acetylesterase [Lachnospiraceae bacterium]